MKQLLNMLLLVLGLQTLGRAQDKGRQYFKVTALGKDGRLRRVFFEARHSKVVTLHGFCQMCYSFVKAALPIRMPAASIKCDLQKFR